MTTYKSISDALNISHEDIDFEMVEGIDYIPHNVKPIPAWNKGLTHMQGENHPLYGKKHSEESKAKMRASATGRKISEETRLKMSKSHMGRTSAMGMLGKKHSEETKAKMSKNARGFSDEARRKQREHMIGKKLSPETRAKMREAALRRNGKIP